MKYFYYSFKEPFKGWIVSDTKRKISDYCSNQFWLAVRVWLWYLGILSTKRTFKNYDSGRINKRVTEV